MKQNTIFLITVSCLASFVVLSQAAPETTPTVTSSLEQKNEGFWTSFTQPFVKAGAWVKEGLKEVIEDTKTTKDIARMENDLRRNVFGYAELYNDLGSLLYEFEESPFEIFIPLSTWEQYVEPLCKEELRNIPIDKQGIEFFMEQCSQTISKKDTTATSIPFIKKIQEHLADDVTIKSIACNDKKSYYDQIKHYFNPTTVTYPWYKKAARWAGWATVGIVGPSTGYFLYQKLLAHYFNRPNITTQDIAKKIELLQQECNKKLQKLDTATSQKLKTALKRSIASLEKTIEKLEQEMITPQKPSTMRKAAGVVTQVSMMALTTYLTYIIFKKFDEYYLTDHSHAPSNPEFDFDQEPSVFEDPNITTPDFKGVNESYFQYLFDVLKEEKNDLANKRLALEQLQKIMGILGQKTEALSRMVLRLKAYIGSKMSYPEHLKESAEYLEKIKAQAIMGILFP